MLVQCPECKGTVSDQAACCPHCGFAIEKGTKCDMCGCNRGSEEYKVPMFRREGGGMEFLARVTYYKRTVVNLSLCSECKKKAVRFDNYWMAIYCVPILLSYGAFEIYMFMFSKEKLDFWECVLAVIAPFLLITFVWAGLMFFISWISRGYLGEGGYTRRCAKIKDKIVEGWRIGDKPLC